MRVRITLLLLLNVFNSFPQERPVTPVRFMFYNVENLFDIHDDPLTSDDEFLPSGAMHWSFTRYRKKLNSLYKTIIAAGEWDPPAIVAFCEVENREVIEDLVDMTGLSRFGYSIVHENSPDPRGIDVALIYRTSVFRLIEYEYMIPPGFSPGEYTSRSVLYLKMSAGTDTLHVIVGHWPSRRGGVLAGESLRSAIAGMIRSKADSIRHFGGSKVKMVITGDFNATPSDQVVQIITGVSADNKPFLFNLAGPQAEKGIGTYRYQGIWEMIDQMIVSIDMLNSKDGLCARDDSFRIFSPEFLMNNDPRFPGPSPYPTYRGYRYQGGYSDHLPIILELDLFQD